MESKQEMKESKQKIVYLAGRIQPKTSARFGFINNVLSAQGISCPSKAELRPSGSIMYSGPYVVACDHSCYHGDDKHGASYGCGTIGQKVELTHETTFKRSKDGIRQATHIIAWIDDTDCYGTLVQLGYAHALKKPIYIGYHTSIKPSEDLWFAFKTAKKYQAFNSASEAVTWALSLI